jgi:hypothetical protein
VSAPLLQFPFLIRTATSPQNAKRFFDRPALPFAALSARSFGRRLAFAQQSDCDRRFLLALTVDRPDADHTNGKKTIWECQLLDQPDDLRLDGC